MMCVIYIPDCDKYVGQEYEEPYRYSEYTAGGGCFNVCFEKLNNLLNEDFFKLTIFENKDKAEKWIRDNKFYEFDFLVRSISEL